MSGSLCNSFGSLSAGVHERSRKWCAPQRLRTKITYVLLWLFDQVKQSGELLCPFAALPSLPLAETPPLWFVSPVPPPNSKSSKKMLPFPPKNIVRQSSRSAWPPSSSSLQSSCSSTFQGGFLFLYKPSIQWEGECATVHANVLEIIPKFSGSPSICTFTQVSKSSANNMFLKRFLNTWTYYWYS